MLDQVGGGQEVITVGVSLGAYHAANFALKRADLFPLAICLSGSYDPSTWHGWGERGDATYFNNPMDYVGQPGRRPPRLAALAGVAAARLRPGPVGGHAPARSSTRAFAACCSARESGTSSTSGGTTSPTTGRRGAPARPSSAALLLRQETACPTTDHLIGLLLGTEEDWPTAFETLVRRLGPVMRAPDGEPAHLTTERITIEPFDLRDKPRYDARHRPARLLVLPPARVAEEGRADGRRVPAQQPVHVPVDGEARRLLRDDAARAEGARDGAGAVQEPARQRALGLHGGALQPAVRPRRDRRPRRLPAVHEAVRRRRSGSASPGSATAPSCTAPTTSPASG